MLCGQNSPGCMLTAGKFPCVPYACTFYDKETKTVSFIRIPLSLSLLCQAKRPDPSYRPFTQASFDPGSTSDSALIPPKAGYWRCNSENSPVRRVWGALNLNRLCERGWYVVGCFLGKRSNLKMSRWTLGRLKWAFFTLFGHVMK